MLAWSKRIGLFLVTNLLVMITVSVCLKLFGIEPFLSSRGVSYQSLLIFCGIWGMAGSLISLALSKTMAKWSMGVQIIDPHSTHALERDLIETVRSMANEAGLPMPEVGVYRSPEVNAFATGATKSGALVAVSTGLLERMDRDERNGVLAHELAHIANGDMVTMALLQGVVNAFVMFLARVIALFLTRSDDRESQSSSSFMYYALVMALEVVFMMFGSMVVAWFSRWREFRADSGGAYLAGKGNMIAALEALRRFYEIQDPREEEQAGIQALKISSRSSFMLLFASHPPLEKRIAALKRAEKGSL